MAISGPMAMRGVEQTKPLRSVVASCARHPPVATTVSEVESDRAVLAYLISVAVAEPAVVSRPVVPLSETRTPAGVYDEASHPDPVESLLTATYVQRMDVTIEIALRVHHKGQVVVKAVAVRSSSTNERNQLSTIVARPTFAPLLLELARTAVGGSVSGKPGSMLACTLQRHTVGVDSISRVNFSNWLVSSITGSTVYHVMVWCF